MVESAGMAGVRGSWEDCSRSGAAAFKVDGAGADCGISCDAVTAWKFVAFADAASGVAASDVDRATADRGRSFGTVAAGTLAVLVDAVSGVVAFDLD
jgi:hypothetical protein